LLDQSTLFKTLLEAGVWRVIVLLMLAARMDVAPRHFQATAR